MSHDVSRKRDGQEKRHCFNGITGPGGVETGGVMPVSVLDAVLVSRLSCSRALPGQSRRAGLASVGARPADQVHCRDVSLEKKRRRPVRPDGSLNIPDLTGDLYLGETQACTETGLSWSAFRHVRGCQFMVSRHGSDPTRSKRFVAEGMGERWLTGWKWGVRTPSLYLLELRQSSSSLLPENVHFAKLL